MNKKHKLFLELANPDKNGKSRKVYKTEFVGKYAELETKNGVSWARRETPLAKKYNLVKDNESIQLDGFNEREALGKSIPKSVYDHYRNSRCLMLGTSNPQVDHKDGRYPQLEDPSDVSKYQPLGIAANQAKRQSCKECVATGKRFKATLIGETVDFTEGNEDYQGCKGCFWYDIKEFRNLRTTI